MPDQKPPRFEGDDRESLLTMLRYQRESVVRKVSDLGDDDARRELVPSGTTLLWLVSHLAHAESTWVISRFLGDDFVLPDDPTVDAAIATYRQTWARVDAIVAAASLDDRCRRQDPDDDPVNLRWVLTHLVQETARHAGHADILRELIDGQTGR